MAINTIFTGTTANDGSGEVIRDAFDTVNSNFEFVQRGLYGGLEPAQIKATYVQAGYLISNTYIIANTFVNANSIVLVTYMFLRMELTLLVMLISLETSTLLVHRQLHNQQAQQHPLF